MAPKRVTSPASAKGRDTPDHAEVPSSRSMTLLWAREDNRLWVEGILPDDLRKALASALGL